MCVRLYKWVPVERMFVVVLVCIVCAYANFFFFVIYCLTKEIFTRLQAQCGKLGRIANEE